jgi:hypothetical protein
MNEATGIDPVEPVSLKVFLLSAALWLPLSFFFWFQFAGLFVAPVQLFAEWALAGILGEHLRDLSQSGFILVVEIYFKAPDGTRLSINPMIYGYGLPVLAGLVISTPNSIRHRTMQIVLGYTAIVLVQSWGAVSEVLKNLMFGLGPEGRVVMEQVGLSPTLVALVYQFGYLILPAVVPIAIWILMNRRFFEGIISSANRARNPSIEEPLAQPGGQLDEVLPQGQAGDHTESDPELDEQK